MDQVVFNGVDGVTGRYLSPPLTVKQMFDVLRRRQGVAGETERALPHGADPRNLDQAGWGVVFAGDGDPAVREALAPLLARRREQAGERFRELRGKDGYRPEMSVGDFFKAHGVGPGVVEPEKLPYYLLLVGDPEEIPYSFQYALDVGHAVGRLSLDRPEDYAAYARGLLAAETGAKRRPRRMSFLGVRNPEDRPTAMSCDQLVDPLAREMSARHGVNGQGWEVCSYLADRADHRRFEAVLGGDETPAFAFSASHGLGYPADHPGKDAYQGAFLCQDWPGPEGGGVKREHFFAAEDVADDADLAGLVSFHFACFGAGAPEFDDFAFRNGGKAKRLGARPVVSRLPQRLLSHPRGGASAVVGHVDRAWAYSFLWGSEAQIAVFRETLNDLVLGFPIGAAMEYFNRRYTQLSTMITATLHEERYDREVDPSEVVSLWTANNDARSYVLLGDPAARLAVGDG